MEGVNPYYRRSAITSPHEFFGRQREITELYQLLRQHQSISLIGERRTGKSSILNAISFLREAYDVPSNVRFAFVNCLYAEGSPEQRFIKHMLGQIIDDLGIDELPPKRDSLLVAAKEAQRRHLQIVVLMDEIDVLIDNPVIPENLMSFFRAWSEEYGIPFVIASREGRLEPLLSAGGSGSPFWNIFKTMYVGPFSHEEAVELIKIPAERCGMPFKDEEVEWIFERGGHHPFFLQIAASYAFSQRNLELERKHIEFLAEADQHFEYLLDFMPRDELIALAGYVCGQQLDRRIESRLRHKGMLIDEGGRQRVFSSVISEKLRSRYPQSETKGNVAAFNRLFR